MRAGLAALALAIGIAGTQASLPSIAGARDTGDKVGTVWDDAVPGARVVAFGDSVAAGPGIPIQRSDPAGCSRSARNFPSLAATAAEAAAFRDVSCSGARTDQLFAPQDLPYGATAPPQLDALDPATSVVMFGPFGANDAAVVEAVGGCVNALPEPVGLSCARRYTAGGHDRYGERMSAIGPKVAAALRETRSRAPLARVLVIGYPLYIRPGGCWGTQAMWGRDADYIQGLLDRINSILRAESAQAGATYVSLQPPEAVAHTTCAPPGERWVEGLIPDDVTAPFHPSLRGMRAFARIVAGAFTPSGPALRIGSAAGAAPRRGRRARIAVSIANTGGSPASGVVIRARGGRGVRVPGRAAALADIPARGSRRALIRLRLSRRAPRSARLVIVATARGARPAERTLSLRLTR